jgi:hypothetical protein
MSKKSIYPIGSIEYVALFDTLLPNLSEEAYQHLKDDIAENGVQVPIITDEKGNILDGLHRVRAASELELRDIPVEIHPNLTSKEKMEIALRLNSHRRQWSQEERLQVAVKLRHNKYSLRRIGKLLHMNYETVRRHLEQMSATEKFPEVSEGDDGIERPARLKKKPRVILKNNIEAKKSFQDLYGVTGLDIPEKTIDAKQLGRIIREHKADQHKEDSSDVKIGTASLWCGDFREKGQEIESESVDMILTDPLYAKDKLHLWDDLGRLAQRILKPGGVLLSYSGNLYLPQVYESLGKHLQYFWTFAIRHGGGHQTVYAVNVTQMWKPLVAYCKPPFSKTWSPFCDMVSGGQSKEFHKFEQPESEAYYFLEHLCPKNGVICDPMMGSGSTIVSAMALGLTAIGIDIDSTAHATAKQRVEHLQKALEQKAA